MKKVVLSNTYFYRLDPKQWTAHQPFPPLGTLYAASVMRKAGYDVSFHDSNLSEGPDSLRPDISEVHPDYLVIYDDGFNYLTKMCLTVMREAALQMIALGKEANCITIICSSDSTDQYELHLQRGADYVIRGEGEETLLKLLAVLDQGENPFELAGIAGKNLNGIYLNPNRPVLKDLDSLPWPAWDLVDVNSYKKVWLKSSEQYYLNMATTRGCPYKCNWCAKPIYGNRYNSRSARDVVAELTYLQQHFKVDHFWMCDDIFGLKPGWVTSFAQVVKKENLKIRYKIQSRADLLLEEEIIDNLMVSGLDEVWIGAESGSQKILDAMDKGIRVQQIYEATTRLKEKGVKVGFFIQFGYLGESYKDIHKTIKMVLDLMPDSLGISVSYPLPGTKFYDTVKKDLKQKANWTDSDDLAMMFRNTYDPSFYRILHTLLHALYRTKKMRLLVFNDIKKPHRRLLKNMARWGYHLLRSLFLQVQLKIHSSFKMSLTQKT